MLFHVEEDPRVGAVLRALGQGGTVALARDVVAALREPLMPAGHLSPDDLAGVAELAREFGMSKVRIGRLTSTGRLRIFRQLQCGPVYLMSDARQSIAAASSQDAK